ncbi:MAG: TRAM domain-containing protein [Vicinamibacterales bacterium]
MLTPGQILPLRIEKPAAGGRMIARVDGQVVLVLGAIPGEQVSARIERVGRGVAYADVVAIEQASDDRRAVDADPLCGGCLYAHITYARQLEIKSLVIQDAFARIGHLALPSAAVVSGSPEAGYRMRARLHVREGRIGFFREGTHQICEARPTRQLRDDTCDVLDRLAAGLRSLGMAGVREIDVSENLDASQRVVHLERTTAAAPRELSGLGLSDGLTGLTVWSPTTAVARVAVVMGDAHVVDALPIGDVEIRLRRHVLAFFQGNRFLLPSLVSHVVSHVAEGDHVVDLYAGTGLFSVAAARARGARVTAVEGDPTGANDLAFNAASKTASNTTSNTASNTAYTDGHVSAVHQSVEAFVASRHEPPSVLIVDPPRTGMSKEALHGALGMGASTIVYVSCDVATLARDARQLVDASYSLERVEAFDLFPNTPHVESVATFRLR